MSIHKDKERNTYYIRMRVDGRNICRRGFKTKKEAKIQEGMLLDMLKSNTFKKEVSFSSLLESYNQYKKNIRKITSYTQSIYMINRHIKPFFESFNDISEIKASDIKNWENGIYDDYCEGYLKSLYGLLKDIFAYASNFYNIRNPVVSVENFKKPNELQKEMNYFTLDEFNLFIEAVDNLDYRILFEFLFYTGCRLGEALALKWDDFGTNYREVRITKTLTNKIKGDRVLLLPPKTKNAIRNITLPHVLSDRLTIYYDKCRNIDSFSKKSFVFGVVKPLSNTSIERIKNKACKKANLKHIRIHDLRHSHATYLINNGADMLAVSKRLGHSSISVTIDTYTHLMKNKEDELMDILNKK